MRRVGIRNLLRWRKKIAPYRKPIGGDAGGGIAPDVMLRRQTMKDEPQPQVLVAFGFWIRKRAPARPSS